jgi:formylglycine-generating enzyme required for sulfatase activity
MADELITYCENFLLFPELLAEMQRHNPRQYAHFIEPELSQDEPAPSTPELLTIDSPTSLQLVRVPAGEFQMGSIMARDEHARDNELPLHPVHVPEFHIGRYPVTNIQYQAFVQVIGQRAPNHWEEGEIPRGKGNHPVVYVSWHDAVAFCDWLSRETVQSFRLPTEAEWEKAARGADGRIYPWGDEAPDESLCNYYGNVGHTTPIGRYFPQGDSPYGCTDMAGNVWEWCQSLHRPYPYQVSDGRESLEAEGYRMVRGGAYHSIQRDVRCACRSRYFPFSRDVNIGFRFVVVPSTSAL